MDISERYIKMCALAKEIQSTWSYQNGDYVYDTIDGDAGVWYWHHSKDVAIVSGYRDKANSKSYA